jgi:hypothetical protein
MVDLIKELDPSGQVLRSWSLYEAFTDSDYAYMLEGAPDKLDFMHTNALQVFDGSLAHLSPLYRAGNCLISLRETHVIAIVDLDEQRVVWAATGPWRLQHEPLLLEDGSMLVFDNEGGFQGRSRVIQFDPTTKRSLWVVGERQGVPLDSSVCGAAIRLPNGNTFITETTQGRGLEVTPEREIVWEFHSPHIVRKSAGGGPVLEYVAPMFDILVLPEDFPLEWCRRPGA